MKRILLDPETAEEGMAAEAWRICQAAFPPEERRTWQQHCAVWQREEFRFEVWVTAGRVVGVMCWWQLEGFRFLEHFAVDESCRGTGLGTRMLQAFLADGQMPVWLEVELPQTAQQRARIGFYERMGFNISNASYAQPPYRQGCAPIPMHIMTHPHRVTVAEVEAFRQCWHPVIYGTRPAGES